MSFFIQVQQSLVTHRKTLRLARLLGLDRYAVIGRLVALWAWCLDNALGGSLGDDIDAEVLADVMGWSATMGKPSDLLEALLTVGFLEVNARDGHLHIHDWQEHMGRLIAQREASAERMRRMRAHHADDGGTDTATAASSSSSPIVPAISVQDDATGNARYAHVTRTLRACSLQEKSREREEKNNVAESDDIVPVSMQQQQQQQQQTQPIAFAADAALTHAPAPAHAPTPMPLPFRSPTPSSATPSPVKPPTRPPSVKPPTHPTMARVPDPVWDACIAAMGGVAPTNRVERGKWAKGIQALKESLLADGSPPGEIAVRARRYRARYGSAVTLN